MNRAQLSAWFLGLGMLQACGPQSEMVNVQISTGLEKLGAPRNLMSGLAGTPGAHMRVAAGNCIQRNVFVGVRPASPETNPPTPEKPFNTFKVPLETPFAFVPAPADIGAWLNANSRTPPIVVPVARNQLTEFGIVGALISAPSAPAGENCEPLDSSGLANPTFSLVGHRGVFISEDTVVPLRLWAVDTSATPAPAPVSGTATSAASTACAASGDSQDCPHKDFFKLTASPDLQTLFANDLLRLEYFYGLNQADHIVQVNNVSQLSATGFVTHPHI